MASGPDSGDQVTGSGKWSAFDVAAYANRSIDWTRRALARWRAAGLVHQVGDDSITNAALYPADQVKAALSAERHAAVDETNPESPDAG